MKKLIATMIVSVIMGQPILAGPLSMAQWRLTGDPKLPGRFQSAATKYVGAPAIQEAKDANRTMVWAMLGGALAFSLLSWQQFDRASDNEAEAAPQPRTRPTISRPKARRQGRSRPPLRLVHRRSRRRQLRGGSDLAQNHPPRLSRTQSPRRRAARRRILRLFVLRV